MYLFLFFLFSIVFIFLSPPGVFFSPILLSASVLTPFFAIRLARRHRGLRFSGLIFYTGIIVCSILVTFFSLLSVLDCSLYNVSPICGLGSIFVFLAALLWGLFCLLFFLLTIRLH
ncbi:MAG: hypothetical protein RIQ54_243 [Candidatus Parcubacteria bacterium]|jgi:hypothetical protein